ncbi:MPEG1 protein, partial [Polypterus senegalus]
MPWLLALCLSWLLGLVQQCAGQGASLKNLPEFQECKKLIQVPALEVLPGGGWDNLRNVDMGRVMNFSFSRCQTTEDGYYLIPDEVFVIPQKQTQVETNSEIIENWMEHKSSVAHSINVEASFFSVVNGKFSAESQRVKTHQVRDKTSTTRVQVRNHIYSVKTNPNFSFDPRFKRQLVDIANALENNHTRAATYLSELLVLNYGTHVITSIKAGALLVQEDYLHSLYFSDYNDQKSTITASAGVNFFNKVNIGVSGSSTTEDSVTKQYTGNTTYSLIEGHGSIPFYPGITLKLWQEGITNNLVAIDRSGLPLHFFLNKETLEDLPEPTIRRLSKSIEKAIMLYYTVNKHPGCLKLDSKNFNFQANVDDGSCEGVATNFTFGGVYQECAILAGNGEELCRSLEQKNPLTGGFSCAAPYTAVKLRSEVKEEIYSNYECHKRCHGCWVFFSCCDNVCGDVYYIRRVRFTTYWCAAINEVVPEFNGYLFGGLYSKSMQNPITNSQSCPSHFIPLKILQDLSICVSNDYEMASQYAVGFGGFLSCEATNPLAGKSRTACATGFSQHVAAISDGCQVLFCVTSGIFNGGELLPIKLPPFTRPPLSSHSFTNTVMVMTEGEMYWIKDSTTKLWKTVKSADIQKMATFIDPNRNALSGGAAFGVALAVTVVLATVITAAVFGVKRCRRRGYRELVNSSRQNLNEETRGNEAEVEIDVSGSETEAADSSSLMSRA